MRIALTCQILKKSPFGRGVVNLLKGDYVVFLGCYHFVSQRKRSLGGSRHFYGRFIRFQQTALHLQISSRLGKVQSDTLSQSFNMMRSPIHLPNKKGATSGSSELPLSEDNEVDKVCGDFHQWLISPGNLINSALTFRSM